jgi:hypothetical protein
MTYSSFSRSLPRALYFKQATNKANLIVHGQGVILFNASGPCSLTFSNANGVVGLKVSFTDSKVLVNLEPSNEPLVILAIPKELFHNLEQRIGSV